MLLEGMENQKIKIVLCYVASFSGEGNDRKTRNVE